MLKTFKYNLVASLFLFSVSSFSHAESNEELMKLGQWKDPNTGLIWMRCNVGQQWDVSTGTCKGFAKRTGSFFASRYTYAGKDTWWLPSIQQLASIRFCGKKSKEVGTIKVPILGGKAMEEIPYSCSISGIERPTINQEIFLGTLKDIYLSDSQTSSSTYYLNFKYGTIERPSRHGYATGFVRLFRYEDKK